MLIVDFHTHIFPDCMADSTIASMQKESNATAYLNGTLSDLKTSMKKNAISYCVTLPVATKPSQFDTINAFAASNNNKDGILSFGGIHPDNDNIAQRLRYLKSLGIKGIKLHPDYQNCFIDDPRYLRILEECLNLELCVVIHAGLDIGLPTPIHCPVDRIYMVLQALLKDYKKDSKIVLAHVGGHLQWELVEELLVGQNVYFDLAYSPCVMNQDTLIRIIQKHGFEKILFATDSPWMNQGEAISYIQSLPFTPEQLDMIFYKNAYRILDLSKK